jgi:hypothetical protein
MRGDLGRSLNIPTGRSHPSFGQRESKAWCGPFRARADSGPIIFCQLPPATYHRSVSAFTSLGKTHCETAHIVFVPVS